MTWRKREIMEMARQAGFNPQSLFMESKLKAFAKLVREDALAQPEQEFWEPHDTAYRPGGLPQDFIKHEVQNEGDWSEWVNPNSGQYFMKCCDCGLVHEMQFKVVKYLEGDDCEFVADANLQNVFRARRAAPPAAQRTWVELTQEDYNVIFAKARSGEHAVQLAHEILKEKNT